MKVVVGERRLGMDRLVLLVGPSGSGKTTIAKELEKEGYNIIHSYTTRPPREPDEWGHTFIPQLTDRKISYIGHSGLGILNIEGYMEYEDEFGKKAEIPYIYYNSEVIAHKELYGEHYWATKEQYQGKGTSIYVVDPSGAEQVRQNVKDAEIITIYLTADESIRYQRICSRELKKYKEVSIGKRMIIDIEADERIQEDKKIFSKCKCDYVVDANRELEQVVTDIKEIIKESN